MKLKFALGIGCLLLVCGSLKAQYVDLPDTVLRDKIITVFPSCFNAAKQLDTLCAANLALDNIYFSNLPISNLSGVHFFKKTRVLILVNNGLDTLSDLPDSLRRLYIDHNPITRLTNLPATLDSLAVLYTSLEKIEALPNKMTYLYAGYNQLHSYPKLPDSLRYLVLSLNILDSPLLAFPPKLQELFIGGSGLTTIPNLPAGLNTFSIQYSPLLTAIPKLPALLHEFLCDSANYLDTLTLNDSLKMFFGLHIQSHKLKALPITLYHLECTNGLLDSLPSLPATLTDLVLINNHLKKLPSLPSSLQALQAGGNEITQIESFPNCYQIELQGNPELACLPKLPPTLRYFYVYGTKVRCLPNIPPGIIATAGLPVCNATNNKYHCQSYPRVYGFVFNDLNGNGIYDSSDYPRQHIRTQLSNGQYAYTNDSGGFYFSADTLGSYSITITAPPFYNSVPLSYVHNFTFYDDAFLDTFALQANTIKDSLDIHITANRRGARRGFPFAYNIRCENVGTTMLAPKIVMKYDNAKLTYDSSSLAGIMQSADSLVLNSASLAPGQFTSFNSYFRVKTTTAIGDIVHATATAKAMSATSFDSALVIVEGSYDPNDKQATPEMTPAQVAAGNTIDYTIRFQNTGNDTAFSVVIADTLSNLLQNNVLQMLATSHLCQTTLTNGIVYFEFLNINLPDSNINKMGSNGFVRFRIKPYSNVFVGDVIPNKASIYFDYNSPVATNTCQTFIRSTVLPLSLLSYKASLKNSEQIVNEWVTANELNTSHFNVQRSSNGKDFRTIGTVQAKAARATTAIYGYVDNALEKVDGGKLYYRLEVIDKDGSKVYSSVETVKFKSANDVSIYPNPAHDVVTVEANNLKSVKLTDNTGRIMIGKEVLNQNHLTVPLHNLPKGVYLLQVVTTSGNTKTQKLVVE